MGWQVSVWVAPRPGLPAAVVGHRQSRPDQHLSHVHPVGLHPGHDAEILVPPGLPQRDVLGLLQPLTHPLPGLQSHPLFRRALGPDLRGVHPAHPHRNVFPEQGVNAGNVEPQGVAVVVAEIDHAINVVIGALIAFGKDVTRPQEQDSGNKGDRGSHRDTLRTFS